jgi:hypothetical protein
MMKQHFRHSFGLGLMILAALFSLFPTPLLALQGDTLSSNASPSSSPSSKPTPKSSVAPVVNLTPASEETPAPVVESNGGLKIENTKVVTARQENSISWTTNSPSADLEFHYGTSKSQLTSNADVTKQDDGSYKVSLANLKLGTLYYFVIKASTADSLQGATYSATFTTRGYPVQLTIEQNHLMIANATVKIEGRTFIANANAIITTELSDGTHTAKITLPGSTQTYSTTFTVIKKTTPATGDLDAQAFALNITLVRKASPPESSTPFMLTLIGAGVAAIAIISLVGFLIARRRRTKDGAVSADADLLAATYGDAYTQMQRNTPEPNLDTINMPQLGIDIPESTSAPSSATPIVDVQASQGAAPAPSTTSIPGQIDPASLPLPPMAETYNAPIPTPMPAPPGSTLMPVPTPVPTPEPIPAAPAPSNYSEAEQLSPELTQVEASQQIEPVPTPSNDEASAVYDEATGELEILHNHNSHDTSPAAKKPAPVVQKPAVPEDPTLLSIHQHPSSSSADPTALEQTVSDPGPTITEATPIPAPIPQQPLRVNPQT